MKLKECKDYTFLWKQQKSTEKKAWNSFIYPLNEDLKYVPIRIWNTMHDSDIKSIWRTLHEIQWKIGSTAYHETERH